jgi:transcriptional regulator with XRE-family HTH domain
VKRRRGIVATVARRIAAIRRQRGLTQEQLAEILCTATRNVQRIESGQNLKLETLERVALALGVAPADLLKD